MTDITLGQRIAERRKLLGLSQEAFGEKMGVSRQAASKWEADAATPEIEKLIAMSRLFGVSLDWLLGANGTQLCVPAQTEEVPSQPEETLPQPEKTSPQPKRKRRWLIALCALVTAVSLILMIFAFAWGGRSQNRIAELTESNRQLEARLENATSRLDSMEAALRTQGDDNISLMDQLCDLETENQTLTKQLADAKNKISSAEKNQWKEQVFPETGVVMQWMLSASAGSLQDNVELRFSCTLDNAGVVRKVTLRAVLDGQEVVGVECQPYAQVHTAALELDPANGYVYYTVLSYTDGTEVWMELTDHGLSNLKTELQIKKTVSLRGDKVTAGGQKFWLAYSDVTLTLPSLLPADAPISWSDMKLVYYCKEEAVEERKLSEIMAELSMNDPRYLCFSTPTLTFTMSDKEDGTRHEIWLEGTVTIDGTENPVRVLLTRCDMEQGVMTLRNPDFAAFEA